MNVCAMHECEACGEAGVGLERHIVVNDALFRLGLIHHSACNVSSA